MSTSPRPNIAPAPSTNTGSATSRVPAGVPASAQVTTATVVTEAVTASVNSVTANGLPRGATCATWAVPLNSAALVPEPPLSTNAYLPRLRDVALATEPPWCGSRVSYSLQRTKAAGPVVVGIPFRGHTCHCECVPHSRARNAS